MLDHVSIGARDLRRLRAFYVSVLAKVGMRVVDEETGRFVDFGEVEGRGPEFSLEIPVDGRPATAGNGVHVAFLASDPGVVDAFHATALALGGRSDVRLARGRSTGPIITRLSCAIRKATRSKLSGARKRAPPEARSRPAVHGRFKEAGGRGGEHLDAGLGDAHRMLALGR